MGKSAADNKLFIRADANTQIGTGHLMRCLALAQQWQAQGGLVTFIANCHSDSLRQRLLDEGFRLISLERSYPDPADWETTSQVLTTHPGTWVVLDGYHFDPNYQCQVKNAGYALIVVDDMAHLEHYFADIVLNQNMNAEGLSYACQSYTRFLLGTRYTLFRSEFLAWRGRQREIPTTARKVLVTLGGGDPDNQTIKVIQALHQVDVEGLEVVVVVGSVNPHLLSLEDVVAQSQSNIRFVQNVTDMPALMAWADVAISAGGSTCWELAFMGLPNLILVLADNQQLIAQNLHLAGVAINLGWHETVSVDEIGRALRKLLLAPTERERMSKLGQQLVDGEGGNRVIQVLTAGKGIANAHTLYG
jgi:UDP-2,4-diacetamido-2,4,6-trideoxy-beta-L-altropyranose hydrolase